MSTRYFENLRRGQRQNISLVVPNVAANTGIAFQESATAGTAELADGTKRAMFITRPVVTELPNPTIAEMMGQGAQPLETPYLGGYEAALEDSDEFATNDVYSGSGMLTSGTALKTKCGFKDGKPRVAQSGELAEFMLVEKVSNPPNAPSDAGLCYRFERIEGVVI